MTHVAVPVLSVVAVQVSEPLRVKVTGSSGMGVSVVESVRTAETGVGDEKSPETGWTVERRRRRRRDRGSARRHVSSSSTESP